MAATSTEQAHSATQPTENAKLYRLEGQQPKAAQGQKKNNNADRRVPITEEAFQAALKIRAQVQKRIRMRPDLSIVVSAMLTQVADTPELVEAVAQYGLRVSTRAVVKEEAKPAQQPPASATSA